MSLVLARGQGDLVLEAVKTARKNHRGRDGGRGASAEWSQTDCQPCVSSYSCTAVRSVRASMCLSPLTLIEFAHQKLLES